MSQPFRIVLSIFTAIWLSGCEALVPVFAPIVVSEVVLDYATYGPGQRHIAETEIDADELESVRTIALLNIPDPPNARKCNLEFEDIRFGDTTRTFLKQMLKENGFEVIEYPAKRTSKNRLFNNYQSLDSKIADAYLDLAPVSVGYIPCGLSNQSTEEVFLYVALAVRLVSAGRKEVIYAGSVQYSSATHLAAPGMKIEAPEEHRYESYEALNMDKEEALQHLVYGIEAISASIVKKVTKGEFVSVLSAPVQKILSDNETEAASVPQVNGNYISQVNGNYISDISGTYVSEITSNSKWQFTKKYQKLKIKFTQNGNKISGVDDRFNTKIEATIVGDVINFYVLAGQATGFYDVEGEWKISSNGTRFEGTWEAPNSADWAKGNWILKKIE